MYFVSYPLGSTLNLPVEPDGSVVVPTFEDVINFGLPDRTLVVEGRTRRAYRTFSGIPLGADFVAGKAVTRIAYFTGKEPLETTINAQGFDFRAEASGTFRLAENSEYHEVGTTTSSDQSWFQTSGVSILPYEEVVVCGFAQAPSQAPDVDEGYRTSGVAVHSSEAYKVAFLRTDNGPAMSRTATAPVLDTQIRDIDAESTFRWFEFLVRTDSELGEQGVLYLENLLCAAAGDESVVSSGDTVFIGDNSTGAGGAGISRWKHVNVFGLNPEAP